jgi:hypothetical protein
MKTFIQTIPTVHLPSFAQRYSVGSIVGVPNETGVDIQYRVVAFKVAQASPDMIGPRVSLTITLEPLPIAPPVPTPNF